MQTTEQPLITFQILSDIHVGASAADDENCQNLIAGLKDIRTFAPESSALITTGDNTASGRPEEAQTFFHILDEYCPFPDDRVLIALGNHDARGPGPASNWHENPDDDNPFWNNISRPLYLELNARYMPKDQPADTVYFDKWIDGFHFIVLNTERGIKDACSLSDRQIAWLDEKLAESSDDRPSFVFVHQPLCDTHWRSNFLNGFGKEDAKVKQVLKKHPQTIMMCGHIHNGLGLDEAVIREYGTTVEVPSFNRPENGYAEKGGGYHVMVYHDRIVFHARNFRTSTWLPQYDIEVKLPVPAVIYQSAKTLDPDSYTAESFAPVRELMSQCEAVFWKKYDQEGFDWESTEAAGRQLFTKEFCAGAEQTAAALQEALRHLQPKNL